MKGPSGNSPGIINNNINRSRILLNLLHRLLYNVIFRNITSVSVNFDSLGFTEFFGFSQILEF